MQIVSQQIHSRGPWICSTLSNWFFHPLSSDHESLPPFFRPPMLFSSYIICPFVLWLFMFFPCVCLSLSPVRRHESLSGYKPRASWLRTAARAIPSPSSFLPLLFNSIHLFPLFALQFRPKSWSLAPLCNTWSRSPCSKTNSVTSLWTSEFPFLQNS